VTVYVGGIGTPVGNLLLDAVQLEEGTPASVFKERGN